MIKPQTLKGFRDFLPKEAKKRQYTINILRSVFESYGFEPLETPALEYEEILAGKYGEEGDQLMYKFIDRGGRKVALRYDQTVPLARVIAQYGSTGSPQIILPFKRYQIQPVWRAENPQKGRFREFLQCDADIVEVDSPLSDAEAILVAAKAIEKLGFTKYKVLINDRSGFNNIPKDAIASIDKLKKIGKDGVLEELIKKGFTKEKSLSILQCMEGMKPTDRLLEVFSLLEKFGINSSRYEFSPTLARGLNYYTGLIFEIEIEGYTAGSVCGGGRYNNLIGMFLPAGRQGAGRQVPAVGFAFGFDRLIEAMEQLILFPKDLDTTTKVLITIFSKEFEETSLKIFKQVQDGGINSEIYLDPDSALQKQLKYANQKNIPYVIIIGPEEVEKNMVTVRNMKTREQKQVTIEEAIEILK